MQSLSSTIEGIGPSENLPFLAHVLCLVSIKHDYWKISQNALAISERVLQSQVVL